MCACLINSARSPVPLYGNRRAGFVFCFPSKRPTANLHAEVIPFCDWIVANEPVKVQSAFFQRWDPYLAIVADPTRFCRHTASNPLRLRNSGDDGERTDPMAADENSRREF